MLMPPLVFILIVLYHNLFTGKDYVKEFLHKFTH